MNEQNVPVNPTAAASRFLTNIVDGLEEKHNDVKQLSYLVANPGFLTYITISFLEACNSSAALEYQNPPLSEQWFPIFPMKYNTPHLRKISPQSPGSGKQSSPD